MRYLKLIPYIIAAILIILGLTFVLTAHTKQEKYDRINECILDDDFHMTATEAKKLQTEESAVLFIMERDEVKLENQDLVRNEQVTELSLIGNSGILLPNCTILEYEDLSTCMISSKTAYALFGTDQLDGAKVTLNDVEYRVMEVIPSNQNFIIHEVVSMNAVEGKNSYFSLLYYDTSLTNAKDSIDQFMMKQGWTMRTFRYDAFGYRIQKLVEGRNTLFQKQYLKYEGVFYTGWILIAIGSCIVLPKAVVQYIHKRIKKKR